MHIYVDADACPRVIKDIIFRASKRLNLRVTLVANKPMYVPSSKLIDSIMVAQGFDVADERIIEIVQPGDLVISEDIPLAAEVVEKGAIVLTTHGRILDSSNIGEALSMRNFMDDVRSSGIQTGGPSAFSNKDREKFANSLQRILQQKANS
ncbi:YaiI/YqxD family protein [bacterium]|nr:YaiI/YqxD family protein [bacterium]